MSVNRLHSTIENERSSEIEMQKMSLVANDNNADDHDVRESQQEGLRPPNQRPSPRKTSWVNIPMFAFFLIAIFLLNVWIEHLLTKNKSQIRGMTLPCPDETAGRALVAEKSKENKSDDDFQRRKDWVLHHYNVVSSGGSIFESGCEMNGWNLLTTKEILEQNRSVENILLYGVYQHLELVEKARSTIKQLAPDSARNVCFSNSSTNLYFVPSSSFDLVFSGNVVPLEDPLGLADGNDGAGGSPIETTKNFCKSGTVEGKTLARLAQQAQEEWFASWVRELIRVVKPGKIIGLEEVGESLCQNTDSGGGVDKGWWLSAVKAYGWDVDPDSVVIEDSKGNGARYNVAMRKTLY